MTSLSYHTWPVSTRISYLVINYSLNSLHFRIFPHFSPSYHRNWLSSTSFSCSVYLLEFYVICNEYILNITYDKHPYLWNIVKFWVNDLCQCVYLAQIIDKWSAQCHTKNLYQYVAHVTGEIWFSLCHDFRGAAHWCNWHSLSMIQSRFNKQNISRLFNH